MEKEARIHQCSRTRRAYAFTVTGEWVGNTRMLINAVLGSYAEEPQLDRKHTRELESSGYEFTSSGILYTNHINCRDQLCVNLDTGELIQFRTHCNSCHLWQDQQISHHP